MGVQDRVVIAVDIYVRCKKLENASHAGSVVAGAGASRRGVLGRVRNFTYSCATLFQIVDADVISLVSISVCKVELGNFESFVTRYVIGGVIAVATSVVCNGEVVRFDLQFFAFDVDCIRRLELLFDFGRSQESLVRFLERLALLCAALFPVFCFLEERLSVDILAVQPELFFLGIAIEGIECADRFDINVVHLQVRDGDFHFWFDFIFNHVDGGIAELTFFGFAAENIALEDNFSLLCVDFFISLFCFVFFNKFPSFWGQAV